MKICNLKTSNINGKITFQLLKERKEKKIGILIAWITRILYTFFPYKVLKNKRQHNKWKCAREHNKNNKNNKSEWWNKPKIKLICFLCVLFPVDNNNLRLALQCTIFKPFATFCIVSLLMINIMRVRTHSHLFMCAHVLVKNASLPMTIINIYYTHQFLLIQPFSSFFISTFFCENDPLIWLIFDNIYVCICVFECVKFHWVCEVNFICPFCKSPGPYYLK